MASWKPRRPASPRTPRDPHPWTQDFAGQFPSWLRDRGDEYFSRGAVELEAVSEAHVRAIVQGGEPYTGPGPGPARVAAQGEDRPALPGRGAEIARLQLEGGGGALHSGAARARP